MKPQKLIRLAALPVVLAAALAQAATWQEGETYAAGSVVSYAGVQYKALVTHTAYAGANWNPADTQALWQRVTGASPSPVATPAPQPTPTPIVASGVWSAGAVYTAGDRTSHDGGIYEAKWWTRGDNPAQSGQWGAWKRVGEVGTTPTPKPSVTPTPVAATPTPKPTVTPTPVVATPTPKPTVSPTPVAATPTPKPSVTPTPVAATPTPKPTVTPTPVGPTPTPVSPSTGKIVGAYFAQWGVYGRGYEVADIASSGSASHLTFINYAFGNLYVKNGGYECDILTRTESGNGDGGDAWADFGRTPSRRVDPADTIKW
uniref:carbohydrate-binding protein n=1 Tax=Chitinolyticbacter albus TaxID=2961951 RepID=UPI00210D976D